MEVWGVGCGMWGVEVWWCGVWSVEVWGVRCGVWGVERVGCGGRGCIGVEVLVMWDVEVGCV